MGQHSRGFETSSAPPPVGIVPIQRVPEVDALTPLPSQPVTTPSPFTPGASCPASKPALNPEADSEMHSPADSEALRDSTHTHKRRPPGTLPPPSGGTSSVPRPYKAALPYHCLDDALRPRSREPKVDCGTQQSPLEWLASSVTGAIKRALTPERNNRKLRPSSRRSNQHPTVERGSSLPPKLLPVREPWHYATPQRGRRKPAESPVRPPVTMAPPPASLEPLRFYTPGKRRQVSHDIGARRAALAPLRQRMLGPLDVTHRRIDLWPTLGVVGGRADGRARRVMAKGATREDTAPLKQVRCVEARDQPPVARQYVSSRPVSMPPEGIPHLPAPVSTFLPPSRPTMFRPGPFVVPFRVTASYAPPACLYPRPPLPYQPMSYLPMPMGSVGGSFVAQPPVSLTHAYQLYSPGAVAAFPARRNGPLSRECLPRPPIARRHYPRASDRPARMASIVEEQVASPTNDEGEAATVHSPSSAIPLREEGGPAAGDQSHPNTAEASRGYCQIFSFSNLHVEVVHGEDQGKSGEMLPGVDHTCEHQPLSSIYTPSFRTLPPSGEAAVSIQQPPVIERPAAVDSQRAAQRGPRQSTADTDDASPDGGQEGEIDRHGR
ncbi:unnamed protein product [Vitrella brassicaformis CCMP3155]|uniref:Uncharacterized protein n=1 Tax=Vitrella brassicaformis (strain CCMP3155) TaxID=1169540 RepID=A0A0G4G455_VITBC|nr:unnamed protein product [Vitrella brassicaformis CCMP3155]|eukprot:CEM23216.1 unnamed protein product [Vitrella brassicaformis CCMP3155]